MRGDDNMSFYIWQPSLTDRRKSYPEGKDLSDYEWVGAAGSPYFFNPILAASPPRDDQFTSRLQQLEIGFREGKGEFQRYRSTSSLSSNSEEACSRRQSFSSTTSNPGWNYCCETSSSKNNNNNNNNCCGSLSCSFQSLQGSDYLDHQHHSPASSDSKRVCVSLLRARLLKMGESDEEAETPKKPPSESGSSKREPPDDEEGNQRPDHVCHDLCPCRRRRKSSLSMDDCEDLQAIGREYYPPVGPFEKKRKIAREKRLSEGTSDSPEGGAVGGAVGGESEGTWDSSRHGSSEGESFQRPQVASTSRRASEGAVSRQVDTWDRSRYGSPPSFQRQEASSSRRQSEGAVRVEVMQVDDWDTARYGSPPTFEEREESSPEQDDDQEPMNLSMHPDEIFAMELQAREVLEMEDRMEQERWKQRGQVWKRGSESERSEDGRYGRDRYPDQSAVEDKSARKILHPRSRSQSESATSQQRRASYPTSRPPHYTHPELANPGTLIRTPDRSQRGYRTSPASSSSSGRTGSPPDNMSRRGSSGVDETTLTKLFSSSNLSEDPNIPQYPIYPPPVFYESPTKLVVTLGDPYSYGLRELHRIAAEAPVPKEEKEEEPKKEEKKSTRHLTDRPQKLGVPPASQRSYHSGDDSFSSSRRSPMEAPSRNRTQSLPNESSASYDSPTLPSGNYSPQEGAGSQEVQDEQRLTPIQRLLRTGGTPPADWRMEPGHCQKPAFGEGAEKSKGFPVIPSALHLGTQRGEQKLAISQEDIDRCARESLDRIRRDLLHRNALDSMHFRKPRVPPPNTGRRGSLGRSTYMAPFSPAGVSQPTPVRPRIRPSAALGRAPDDEMESKDEETVQKPDEPMDKDSDGNGDVEEPRVATVYPQYWSNGHFEIYEPAYPYPACEELRYISREQMEYVVAEEYKYIPTEEFKLNQQERRSSVIQPVGHPSHVAPIDENQKKPEKKNGKKVLQCPDCPKSFSQLRNYRYHRSRHEGTNIFQCTCPVCGKKFNDKGYLSSHLKIHKNAKEYQCEYCEKCFNQRVAYNMHVRIHTGVKPHKCTYCEKAFSRKMLLRQHLRTHTGERPYSCAICQKSFADRSNMLLHQKLHSGNRPYACNQCSKTFSKNHHLKTHLNHHLGIKPYACVNCGHTFSQSSNMKTHLKKCCAKSEEKMKAALKPPVTVRAVRTPCPGKAVVARKKRGGGGRVPIMTENTGNPGNIDVGNVQTSGTEKNELDFEPNEFGQRSIMRWW